MPVITDFNEYTQHYDPDFHRFMNVFYPNWENDISEDEVRMIAAIWNQGRIQVAGELDWLKKVAAQGTPHGPVSHKVPVGGVSPVSATEIPVRTAEVASPDPLPVRRPHVDRNLATKNITSHDFGGWLLINRDMATVVLPVTTLRNLVLFASEWVDEGQLEDVAQERGMDLDSLQQILELVRFLAPLRVE